MFAHSPLSPALLPARLMLPKPKEERSRLERAARSRDSEFFLFSLAVPAPPPLSPLLGSSSFPLLGANLYIDTLAFC